jgi:ketosteroid isomerase-like protein
MNRHVAENVTRAIEEGDKATLRRQYWPDAQFWHNTDRVVRDADAGLGATELFMDRFSDRRFTDLRIQELPDGFVQQYRLTARTPQGSLVAFDACMVCKVRDGLIALVEEYLDSAAVGPVFALLSG